MYDETALAAWYPVKGTDWFAVVKIDQDNLMAPVRNLAFWFNLTFISILMIFGIILLFIWHILQRSQILAADLREKQLLNNFYTLPFIGIGVLPVTLDKWIHFDEHLVSISSGIPGKNSAKKDGRNCAGQSCTERISDNSRRSGEKISAEFTEEENVLPEKTAKQAIAEVHSRCVVAGDGTLGLSGRHSRGHHRTQRLANPSQNLARLSQLYATLSHCNQAIVHSRTEKELFEQICYGIVNYGAGRFNVAWIGLIDRKIRKSRYGRLARYSR